MLWHDASVFNFNPRILFSECFKRCCTEFKRVSVVRKCQSPSCSPGRCPRCWARRSREVPTFFKFPTSRARGSCLVNYFYSRRKGSRIFSLSKVQFIFNARVEKAERKSVNFRCFEFTILRHVLTHFDVKKRGDFLFRPQREIWKWKLMICFIWKWKTLSLLLFCCFEKIVNSWRNTCLFRVKIFFAVDFLSSDTDWHSTKMG